MSENTDVNDDQPAGSSGGFRRSRRSMRRAERAAEREAYITGQQPLLTRWELKRLREKVKARFHRAQFLYHYFNLARHLRCLH